MTELAAASALATAALTQEELFPIREVSRLTGVNPVTLRAWERRYGITPAERSPTGRRFYTREQVERLRLLKSCSDAGHRIGSLVELSTEKLSRLEYELEARNALSDILEAVKALDIERLQSLLQTRAERDPPEHFIRATVLPLMREIGSLWAAGDVLGEKGG